MIKRAYDKHYFTNILYKAKPSSERDRKRHSLICDYKSSGNLLEVGCGDSYLLKLLTRDFKVEGVDVSEYAVSVAEKLLGSGKVHVGDVERDDLTEKKYDVVVAFNILEHLVNPTRALGKIYSSLRNGGVLVGSVPNNHKVVGRAATQLFNALDRTHVSTHNISQWRKVFLESGFCKMREFGEIPVGRNRSLYVNGNRWPHIALNYIFVYSK